MAFEERQLSMEDAVRALSEQQRFLIESLLQLHGEVRAMKLVMDALAEAHPDPQRLFELWHSLLPEVTDDLTASDSATTEQQREGWKNVLQHYSEYFQALRDRACEDD